MMGAVEENSICRETLERDKKNCENEFDEKFQVHFNFSPPPFPSSSSHR